MSAEESFLTLKNFFETRAAVRQALSYLDEQAEIGIVIGGSVECTLGKREGKVVFEKRVPSAPDIVITISPESVTILNDRTKDEVGDIIGALVKEVLAGDIKVKMTGNPMELLRRGYTQLIARGGPEVLKIMNHIKQMKR